MKFALSLFFLVLSTHLLADDAERFFPLTEVEIADGRDVIAEADGRVVYIFDKDAVNVSNCYDGCAKTWPPRLVTDTAGIKAPMGVTKRKDGTLQLTLDSKPLYFFIGDKNPGDIKGDGLGGVWHIIED